jgi:hypothetical protein
MPDFSAELALRNWTFLLLRAAIYFGVAAAFAVAGSGGAWIGLGIGLLAGPGGRVPGVFWGALGGLAFVGFMLHWLRDYFLFLIDAPHLAALAAADENAPGIGDAMNSVQRRFREAGLLAALERQTRGISTTVFRVYDLRPEWLPADTRIPPSAQHVAASIAAAFATRAVLARLLQDRTRNLWAEMRDALVLIAEHHRRLWQDALLLAGIGYAAAAILFAIALIPAASLARTYPDGYALIAILLAAVFAWSVKQALIDPFLTAAFLQAVARATEGYGPDAIWEERLASASPEFRALQERATAGTRTVRQRSIR